MKETKGTQLELFSPALLKSYKLDETLNRIKKEFGEKAVITGRELSGNPAKRKATKKKEPGISRAGE